MKVNKLLYESFERSLSEEEAQKLQNALAVSSELRLEYERIRKLRNYVSAGAVRDFSAGFEDRVMDNIKPSGIKKDFLNPFLNSLSLLFGKIVYATVIIIIISVSYNLTKSGSISVQSALGISAQNGTTIADSFYNKLYSYFN